MKKVTRRIIGLDFFLTKPNEAMTVNVKSLIGDSNGIGLESNEIVRGRDVALKNISAAQYRDLLAGNSYLEFWIEAIDHTKPTTNNRLYTEEEFGLGMERVLHRVIRNGGMQPGEGEHPDITPDPKLTKEENMAKISSRLMRMDLKNITHYVIDTKTEGGKTYFLIRTNPENPRIVKDIALGKVPTFSIRTMGDFPPVNGVLLGKNLLVITTDYVYNPANVDSKPIATNMKFVDPANATEVKVELVAKVGNESVEVFKLAKGETMIMGIESDNTITLNILTEDTSLSNKAVLGSAFSSIF